MQSTIEKLGALERRLTMAVPAADIDREVESRLKRLARNVKMHGFRPGKVPMRVVAQQYGPQVRSEVIGDAIQKEFEEALRTQNIRIAGYPRIEPRDGASAEQLEFSATFEVYPEVSLGDLAARTIERPAVEVTDAEVDKTIEILRKQRVRFDPVDRACRAGDRVTIDFVGRIDGEEFTGGKGEDFAFVIGEGRMLPEFEASVTGLQNGESKRFEVKFPEDYGGKDVAGKTAAFEATLKKVEASRLPELDADFAKSLGVSDGDLEKMRAEIRANVEREVKGRVSSQVKQRVMDALLESTSVELPKALVEGETQRLVSAARSDLQARGLRMENMPIDPSIFEEQARRRVALGLILAELVKQHDLAAKPEQVRALVDEQAQSYEQPGEVVKWFYSQPERVAEFEGLAVEQNVVDWVLSKAKVVEKPVEFDELMGKAT